MKFRFLVVLLALGCGELKPTPDSGPGPCTPGAATLDEFFTQTLGPKCLT